MEFPSPLIENITVNFLCIVDAFWNRMFCDNCVDVVYWGSNSKNLGACSILMTLDLLIPRDSIACFARKNAFFRWIFGSVLVDITQREIKSCLALNLPHQRCVFKIDTSKLVITSFLALNFGRQATTVHCTVYSKCTHSDIFVFDSQHSSISVFFRQQ